jgi:hypothetical protein
MIPIDLAENIFTFAKVAGLVIYWIIAFVILYHFNRFGVGTQPKRLSAIFLFGSVFLSSAYVILFVSLNLSELISRL